MSCDRCRLGSRIIHSDCFDTMYFKQKTACDKYSAINVYELHNV